MNKIFRFWLVSIVLAIPVGSCAGLAQTTDSFLTQVVTGPIGPESKKNVIVIFVNTGIYNSIIMEINQYAADIRSDGFRTVIEVVSGGTPNDLRNELKKWLPLGLLGAVCVGGDFPVPLFRVVEEYEQIFPCHLFYEDLDGKWIDFDDDGVFDEHQDGSGDRDPEIWFSIINFSSLDTQFGSEVDFLIDYFSRNHSWRLSWPEYKNSQRRALLFPDDAIYDTDWPYEKTCPEVKDFYGDQVDVVQNAPTTKSNYIAKIQEDYEYAHVMSHGAPTVQAFSESDGTSQLITAADIIECNPQPLFYEIVACSVFNYYEVDDNIAEAYLSTNGLVLWGVSKNGGGFQSGNIEKFLANGTTFGDAWHSAWYDNALDDFCEKSEAAPDEYFACRHSEDYARVLMGDPAFRLEFDIDNDNMADGWETNYFGDLSHVGGADSDNDGLTDLEEYRNGTDPHDADSDDDGITDSYDSLVDSDFDGIADAEDLCQGCDDGIDEDNDGIPDGCDDSLMTSKQGFDYLSYLSFNSDLPQTWSKAECMGHYRLFGFNEHRAVSFNLEEYLNANPDLPSNWTYEEALSHYIIFGRNENRLLAFDGQEYMSLYPDLPQDWNYDQAYAHYVYFGKKEGRIASFDETAYLELYPDLPPSWGQAEAFYHYLLYGRKEGRVYDPYDEDVFNSY